MEGGSRLHLGVEFSRRYWAALVVTLLATVVAFVQPWVFQPPDYPVIRSDGVGYHSWTRGFLEGDLLSCEPYEQMMWPEKMIPIGPSGNCAKAHPPGLAIIRFPVMAFVTAATASDEPSTAEGFVVLAFGVLAAFVAAVAIIATARRLGSSWFAANAAVIAVMFGTGMFHYAGFDASFAHGFIAAMVAVFALMTVQIPGLLPGRSGGAARLGRLGIVAWFVVPLLLMLSRQTSLMILVPVLGVAAVYAWRSHGLAEAVRILRWPCVAAAAGVLAALAAQIAYNSWAMGSLTFSSYGDQRFYFGRFRQLAVLFSIRRGITVTYPIVLVTFASLVVARRWWVMAAAGIPTLLLALLYGSWWAWDLSGGFGHRGFVDVAPLWGIALAVGISAVSRNIQLVLYCGVAVCIFITTGLMVAYWRADIGFYGISASEWFRYGIGPESLAVRLWRLLRL